MPSQDNPLIYELMDREADWFHSLPFVVRLCGFPAQVLFYYLVCLPAFLIWAFVSLVLLMIKTGPEE